MHAFHGVLPGAMLGAKVIELEEAEEEEKGSSKYGDDEHGHDCLPVPPGYPIESHRIKEIYLKQELQDDGSVGIRLYYSKNKWDPKLGRWHPVIIIIIII